MTDIYVSHTPFFENIFFFYEADAISYGAPYFHTYREMIPSGEGVLSLDDEGNVIRIPNADENNNVQNIIQKALNSL